LDQYFVEFGGVWVKRILSSVLVLLLSALLISLVSAQTILWEHTWGGSGVDGGTAIAVKGDYIYIAGHYSGDAFVAKFDLDGNLIWDRALDIEGDTADDVAVDGQGNVYIVGRASDHAEYGFVAKFDSDGDLKWSKIWPGSGGKGVAVDSAGNIYVAGEVSGAGRDVLVMKLDSDGNILWQKSWGGSGDDWAQDIALDSSGNVYVTGHTPSFTSPYGPYMFLLKFDGSGNFKWNKLWVVGHATAGHGLTIDSPNNIYIAGKVTFAGKTDAVLVKFDSDGNLLWARGWGGGDTDVGMSVAVDSSTVYLAGYTASFGGFSEAFVAAFTSSGNLVWDGVWGGVEKDGAYDIAFAGPLYLTGYTYSSTRSFRDPSATITSPSATIMTPSATIGDPGITLTDQGSAYDPSITLDQLQGQDAFILSFEPPPAPVGGEIMTSYSQRSWKQITLIMALMSLASILTMMVMIRKHYVKR